MEELEWRVGVADRVVGGRSYIADAVDVEVRVGLCDGGRVAVECVAARRVVGRELAFGWVVQVVARVGRVAALIAVLFDQVQTGLVQVQVLVVGFHKVVHYHVFLQELVRGRKDNERALEPPAKKKKEKKKKATARLKRLGNTPRK